MPAGLVPLAATMLTNLAGQPAGQSPGQSAGQPEAGPQASAAAEAGSQPAAPPAPEPGEIRLPLVFENGKATVGGMPVGPAPRLD